MKRTGLNAVIIVSSLMALSSCVKNEAAVSASSEDNIRREVSFSFNGFQTQGKKPFIYLEESMKYIPLTISFQKGREKGNLEIKHFSLSSTNPVSIFKDLNNNKALDENERATLFEIDGTTSIDWIDDSTPKKDDSILSANYMLYKEDGFIDGTVVSYTYMADAVALEKYCEGEEVLVSNYADESSRAPSSVTLLYDRPEDHINIIGTPEQLYKTNVAISCDDVLRIVSVENAEFYIQKDQTYKHYKYEGLDGEIVVKYAINIKDSYYKGKDINFGEGEYRYKVPVNGHEHTVSEPRVIEGMKDYVCECNVFHAYELDSTNSSSPSVPDLNNPDQMMGNQMFRIEWNVSGIRKGKYKVFVNGSTAEKQKDLRWFNVDEGNASYCPSYIRIGEDEMMPITDKTFGETFGEGSGWRWTNSPIFEIDVPEGLEELSIQSGNNNGRLNDYNMFLRGLLLVPYSEDFTPSNL